MFPTQWIVDDYTCMFRISYLTGNGYRRMTKNRERGMMRRKQKRQPEWEREARKMKKGQWIEYKSA
jgi:hypothetical protein